MKSDDEESDAEDEWGEDEALTKEALAPIDQIEVSLKEYVAAWDAQNATTMCDEDLLDAI